MPSCDDAKNVNPNDDELMKLAWKLDGELIKLAYSQQYFQQQ